MKILVCGDWHGNVPHAQYIFNAARSNGVQKVVQLGDFGYGWDEKYEDWIAWAAGKAEVELYWLDGNHENFDKLEVAIDMEATEPQLMKSGLWYLPRGSTWEWEGVRFMAFGGAYSVDKPMRVTGDEPPDRWGKKRKKSWWAQEKPTEAQWQRAHAAGKVDVLLTHDAPRDCVPFIREDDGEFPESQRNRNELTALCATVCPSLHIHGHYHHLYNKDVRGIRMQGLDCDGSGRKNWRILELPGMVLS